VLPPPAANLTTRGGEGARGEDYDDLVAKLPDVLPAMNLQRLADRLVAAGFKARAVGDGEATK
jgi:hypothetical protein